MLRIKVLEKIKTHVDMLNNYFTENRAIYVIMLKNMVQSDRQRIKIMYVVSALHVG
jgi:hypothetical protein